MNPKHPKTFRIVDFKKNLPIFESAGFFCFSVWVQPLQRHFNITVHKTDKENEIGAKCGEYKVNIKCHPDDAFNMSFGIRLAVAKILRKIIADHKTSVFIHFKDFEKTLDILSDTHEDIKGLIAYMKKGKPKA